MKVESFLKLKIIRTRVRLQSVSVLMTLGLTWLAACRASITVGGGGVLSSRTGGRGGLLRWINQLLPVRLTVIVLEVRTNRLSLQPQTGLQISLEAASVVSAVSAATLLSALSCLRFLPIKEELFLGMHVPSICFFINPDGNILLLWGSWYGTGPP